MDTKDIRKWKKITETYDMALDDILIEPIAKGYNKLPSPIKKGTSNFTSNIAMLLSIPNNLLQGNFKDLGHSVECALVEINVVTKNKIDRCLSFFTIFITDIYIILTYIVYKF